MFFKHLQACSPSIFQNTAEGKACCTQAQYDLCTTTSEIYTCIVFRDIRNYCSHIISSLNSTLIRLKKANKCSTRSIEAPGAAIFKSDPKYPFLCLEANSDCISLHSRSHRSNGFDLTLKVE